MKESPFDLHDMIAALATPMASSALAVIRTAGEGSIQAVDRLFSGSAPLADAEGNTLRHGFFLDPKTGEKIDEVVVAVYRAPASYTGEDAVEIFCHGSIPCIARILQELRDAGFRDAGPGEFTQRAFLNNKMDLTRALAVNEIVTASTDRGRMLAMHRLSGRLHDAIEAEKKELVGILSGVEIMIDYPDEEYEHRAIAKEALSRTRERLSGLAGTFRIGKVIQEGAVMVIAGRTNAGKSTLFNLLLKEDRSIVSEYHGTTRDFIEARISIAGIPIRLFDTAGLREELSADSGLHPVEAEGIKRTRSLIDSAQVILYCADASSGLLDVDLETIAARKGDPRMILVWNKADIAAKPCPEGFLSVSALLGQGLDGLEQAVAGLLLGKTSPPSDNLVIDSQRQKDALDLAVVAIDRAREGMEKQVSFDLLAADLREATDALGAITGEVTSSELLETMFKTFCVGK